MEVESKFNPDDWNGYLHTYETIEEYNAAKKLLPHTARIESTKEAKYISREELPLELYAKMDDFGSSPANVREIETINRELKHTLEHNENERNIYKDTWIEYSKICSKGYIYKLLGQIQINNYTYYLWELKDIQDDATFAIDNNTGFTKRRDDVQYLLTDFKEIYTTYKGMDDNGIIHYGTCLDLDLETSYSHGGSIKQRITLSSLEGVPIVDVAASTIIYDIYAG